MRAIKLVCIFCWLSIFAAFAMANGAADDVDWSAVEMAPMILRGELAADLGELRIHDFAILNFSVSERIKGRADKNKYKIPYFLSDEADLREIQGRLGKRVIMFAMLCIDGRGEICAYDDAKGSIFEESDEVLESINIIGRENEWLYQESLENGCKNITSSRREVEELVSQLDTSEADQKQAVYKLSKLGQKAVPSLICELQRGGSKFRMKFLAVPNGADSFEHHALYSPDLKIDAIDAILSTITGVSFIPLSNGASDGERQKSIRGWMIYLQRMRLDSKSHGFK